MITRFGMVYDSLRFMHAYGSRFNAGQVSSSLPTWHMAAMVGSIMSGPMNSGNRSSISAYNFSTWHSDGRGFGRTSSPIEIYYWADPNLE